MRFFVFCSLLSIATAALLRWPANAGETITLSRGNSNTVVKKTSTDTYTYTECKDSKPGNCGKWLNERGDVEESGSVRFSEKEVLIEDLKKGDIDARFNMQGDSSTIHVIPRA